VRVNELEAHRETLIRQREELTSELAQLAIDREGAEGAELRAALEPLEREVAELTQEAEALAGRVSELEVELVPLRRETKAASAHLRDLWRQR
jgi:chromosome segregation ATPase